GTALRPVVRIRRVVGVEAGFGQRLGTRGAEIRKLVVEIAERAVERPMLADAGLGLDLETCDRSFACVGRHECELTELVETDRASLDVLVDHVENRRI